MRKKRTQRRKEQERSTRAKPTLGEPLVKTDNPAKQKDGDTESPPGERSQDAPSRTKVGRKHKKSKENGVLHKLKHIFPNTYQSIKSIHSPAKVGTGCYRFNYQPGS